MYLSPSHLTFIQPDPIMASSGPSKRKAPQYVDMANTAAAQEDQSRYKRNAAGPQPAAAVPQSDAAVLQSAAAVPQSAVAVPQSDAATVCMIAAGEEMRCALQRSIAAAAKATAAAAVSARDTNAANALPESDRNKLPMSPELMEHLAYVAKKAAAQASTLFRRIAESTANAGSATSSQVMLGYVAAATINAQSAVNQSKLAVAVSEIIHMALYMNK
jgi:hypothetical protein